MKPSFHKAAANAWEKNMKENTFFHRYKEIILGLLMLALAFFYLYHSTLIRTRSTVSVSAKLVPEILGCMVVVLGICQIVAGVRYLARARREAAENGAAPVFVGSEEWRDALPVALTFAVILLYAVFYERLGFVVSSTLCMFAQMWILTPKSKFRPGLFLAISLVVAVVVYVAFRQGLNLSLPAGVLEGLPI